MANMQNKVAAHVAPMLVARLWGAIAVQRSRLMETSQATVPVNAVTFAKNIAVRINEDSENTLLQPLTGEMRDQSGDKGSKLM